MVVTVSYDHCDSFIPRLSLSFFSVLPRSNSRHDGRHGLGMAYSHIKAFGLFSFPHQRKVCAEATCLKYAGENTVLVTHTHVHKNIVRESLGMRLEFSVKLWTITIPQVD